VAASFARAGASLVLADLDTAGLALLEKDEALKNTEFICREVDVRSSESIDALFAAAMARFSKIDIVVNMAFTNVLKPLREMSDAEFHLTMDVCLGGSFRISRTALRHMIPQQTGGSLIHFSSIAAEAALGRGTGAYAAAKAGINALIRELAVECAPSGIRVNGIAPCQTRTPALERLLGDRSVAPEGIIEARMIGRIPLGRLAEPADMSEPCVFLASDAARMITGIILPVDGGFLSQ
jgi:NAD(P)-dependent dehydrogenase (short-subunit alcohol dehydrogenase family)